MASVFYPVPRTPHLLSTCLPWTVLCSYNMLRPSLLRITSFGYLPPGFTTARAGSTERDADGGGSVGGLR